MIALCRTHHDQAAHFTKEYLRELKAASYSVEDIKGRFPTAYRQLVVRVGGLYSGGARTVIRVDGEPVVQLATSENGLLLVSFVLRSSDGQIIARMVENVFEGGPLPPSDLITATTATRVTVWHKPHNVAVDFSLSRITLARLEATLMADRERYETKAAVLRPQIQGQLEGLLLHLPPDIADEIKEDYAGALTLQLPDVISQRVAEFRSRFGAVDLPDDFLRAHFSGDQVGYSVRTWAAANCVDSDGLIPFLNFDNLSLYGRNRQIRIRDGVGDFDYNAVFDCDTAFVL